MKMTSHVSALLLVSLTLGTAACGSDSSTPTGGSTGGASGTGGSSAKGGSAGASAGSSVGKGGAGAAGGGMGGTSAGAGGSSAGTGGATGGSAGTTGGAGGATGGGAGAGGSAGGATAGAGGTTAGGGTAGSAGTAGSGAGGTAGSGAGGTAGSGTGGACATPLSDSMCGVCTGAQCCAEASTCLADTACAMCLADPSGAGCSKNDKLSALNACRVAHCNLECGPDTGPYQGLACTADDQCGPGGTCLSATTDGIVDVPGAPAHGYCTKDCTKDLLDKTDTICGKLSVCISASTAPGKERAYCQQRCDFGAPPYAGWDKLVVASKCHGRGDVSCVPTVDNAGAYQLAVCSPTCSNDAQCTGGRRCDPELGLCVPAAGLAGLAQDGALCDPQAPDRTCLGTCVPVSDTSKNRGLCLSLCELSSSDPLTCGGNTKGLCLFSAFSPLDSSSSPIASGPQDVGRCAPVAPTGKDSDCDTQDGWFVFTVGATKVCAAASTCITNQDCSGQDTCQTVPAMAQKYCLDHTPLESGALRRRTPRRHDRIDRKSSAECV